MEEELLKEIYDARWFEWKKKVIDNHSTPVLLLCIGHGENLGLVTVSTCEEVNDEAIEDLLIQALYDLRDQKKRG